ncbi:MAG: metallophosphoesterase family protein [Deltaproteobacteria bacterium]|nr:metallophosphoesterase family protein [Deltaproteobacteria bacterium]
MRLAIISDIHGNLEAFKEVLADIDRSQIDGLACLGDNIGYGPDSERVVELVRERDIPCVMGNHELAAVDVKYLDWMNPTARKSLVMTNEHLSESSIDYIRTLPSAMTYHGSLCVHGFLPDSAVTYLFQRSMAQLKDAFLAMEEKICFLGHTHDLLIISFDGDKVIQASLGNGIVSLHKDHQYIINVGSVGQPRDSNNNAKYVIWDTASESIEVRFVQYDIAATADKIIELGFPEFNARRLW